MDYPSLQNLPRELTSIIANKLSENDLRHFLLTSGLDIDPRFLSHPLENFEYLLLHSHRIPLIMHFYSSVRDYLYFHDETIIAEKVSDWLDSSLSARPDGSLLSEELFEIIFQDNREIAEKYYPPSRHFRQAVRYRRYDLMKRLFEKNGKLYCNILLEEGYRMNDRIIIDFAMANGAVDFISAMSGAMKNDLTLDGDFRLVDEVNALRLEGYFGEVSENQQHNSEVAVRTWGELFSRSPITFLKKVDEIENFYSDNEIDRATIFQNYFSSEERNIYIALIRQLVESREYNFVDGIVGFIKNMGNRYHYLPKADTQFLEQEVIKAAFHFADKTLLNNYFKQIEDIEDNVEYYYPIFAEALLGTNYTEIYKSCSILAKYISMESIPAKSEYSDPIFEKFPFLEDIFARMNYFHPLHSDQEGSKYNIRTSMNIKFDRGYWVAKCLYERNKDNAIIADFYTKGFYNADCEFLYQKYFSWHTQLIETSMGNHNYALRYVINLLNKWSLSSQMIYQKLLYEIFPDKNEKMTKSIFRNYANTLNDETLLLRLTEQDPLDRELGPAGSFQVFSGRMKSFQKHRFDIYGLDSYAVYGVGEDEELGEIEMTDEQREDKMREFFMQWKQNPYIKTLIEYWTSR